MRNHDDRGRRGRCEEGAAAVEFAILMLLFVPLFLYTTFLYDMLRYRHESQEAVISSAWDYTSYNFFTATRAPGGWQPNPPPGGVENGPWAGAYANNRIIWCDHLGVVDGPAPQGNECKNDQKHHENQALAGHECWLGGNGEQLKCKVEASFHKDWAHPVAEVPANDYQTGGHVECQATLSVYNTFIPQQFMQEFSRVKLTEVERLEGTQGGQGAQMHQRAGKPHWPLKYEYALQVDTWAIQKGKSKIHGPHCGVQGELSQNGGGCADGPKVGEVKNDNNNRSQYRRSKKIFIHPASGYPVAVLRMADFFLQAWNDELLMLGSGLNAAPEMEGQQLPGWDMVVGSNPSHFSMTALSPVAGTKTITRPDVTGEYWTTPYKFGSETRYESVTSSRGNFYLGCQSEEGC